MKREALLEQVLSQIILPSAVEIRAWQPTDFPIVRDLAFIEGWTTLHTRPDDGLRAWQNAWPALLATHKQTTIAFLRALTDQTITLYVAELLVVPDWRGRGIGTALLEVCHLLYPTARFDLISTEHADQFYEKQGFRPFRGFRKSYI